MQPEKAVRLGRLYDLYGALLTPKQRRAVELQALEDLSLGEMAEELGASRQAAFDLLRRTEAVLEGYEARLGLLQQEERWRKAVGRLQELLEGMPPEAPGRQEALDLVAGLSAL